MEVLWQEAHKILTLIEVAPGDFVISIRDSKKIFPPLPIWKRELRQLRDILNSLDLESEE